MIRHFRFLLLPALILGWLSSLSAWSSEVRAETGLPAGFWGSFRGALVGPAGAINGDFTVAIEGAGDGFIVRWPPRRAVEFRPAGREGVFRTSGDAKPLAGGTAYWARFDGTSLIVYSMQVDEHGGYDIHTYIYAPAGSGLDLVIRRIRAGAEPTESKGMLNKYGG